MSPYKLMFHSNMDHSQLEEDTPIEILKILNLDQLNSRATSMLQEVQTKFGTKMTYLLVTICIKKL